MLYYEKYSINRISLKRKGEFQNEVLPKSDFSIFFSSVIRFYFIDLLHRHFSSYTFSLHLGSFVFLAIPVFYALLSAE